MLLYSINTMHTHLSTSAWGWDTRHSISMPQCHTASVRACIWVCTYITSTHTHTHTHTCRSIDCIWLCGVRPADLTAAAAGQAAAVTSLISSDATSHSCASITHLPACEPGCRHTWVNIALLTGITHRHQSPSLCLSVCMFPCLSVHLCGR